MRALLRLMAVLVLALADRVTQSRSIRRSGQPTCAKAFLNARCWSGPDPRGGHYGQRSCEPHLKAEHMAAPTNAANVKKALANSEPSTHGTKPTSRYVRSLVAIGGRAVMALKAHFGRD